MHLRSHLLATAVAALGSLVPRAVADDWRPTPVPAAPAQAAAWIRCFIRVPDNMVTPAEKDLWRDSITVNVGGIRGAFSIWVNGRKIAEAGALAEGQRRRFKVPKDLLEKKAFNVLALQLSVEAARGGIPMTPILAGYFDELLLEGTWETRASEPAPGELKPLAAQPTVAFFTEAGFRPSSTPLARNAETMPGVNSFDDSP